jgi:hypothetical protein
MFTLLRAIFSKAKTEPLRERAELLVPSANIHATSLFVPMLDQFPLLRNVKPGQRDFVVTIASVFIAVTRLRSLKKEDTREEGLMEIVARGLADSQRVKKNSGWFALPAGLRCTRSFLGGAIRAHHYIC